MKKKPKYIREDENRAEYYSKLKILCPCGHKSVIPIWVDRQVCSWSGKYVYRNKKREFEEKLKNALKK